MPSPSPTKFREALEILGIKELMPTTASARELERIRANIRERAFFSARVANAGILQTEKSLVERIVSPEGRAPGEYMDLARFREIVKDYLQSIGYTPEPDKEGTLQDLSSNDRLNLVADTNTQMAQGFGQFMQGQEPEVLDLYPCQELYRLEMRDQPRPWNDLWVRAGGHLYGGGRMIAPKDDPLWTKTLDEGGFNRFGNPYPPFDYNSGMDVRDVSRQEAVELGVIEDSYQAKRQTRHFNEGLQADVKGISQLFQHELEKTLDGRGRVDNGVLNMLSPKEALEWLMDDAINSNVNRSANFGALPQKVADMALKKLGNIADITDFDMYLSSSDIRKNWERHGPDSRSQVKLSKEDFIKIVDMIEQATDVKRGIHNLTGLDSIIVQTPQMELAFQIVENTKRLLLRSMR